MNHKQNYCDYGVVEPSCFGMRTFMGPYIDEPIVSGLDRCLRFFGVKVCKPNYCDQNESRKTVVCVNDDSVFTVGSESSEFMPSRFCQGTSTTSLHSEDSEPHFTNIQDSITYLKSCLRKGNKEEDCIKKISKSVNINSKPTEIGFKLRQNIDTDDLPIIPQCSSPCNFISENCEFDLNAPKVDPRFCTSKRSSPMEIIPSEKNFTNGLFVKDSLPFIPQRSFTVSPALGTSTKYKTGLLGENDSNASLIPTMNTPPKVSINPDIYFPERDRSPRGRSSSLWKTMLSPIMSAEDINIPERDNCMRSMVDSEDSFQKICPLFKNECYTKSNDDLDIIPICNAKSCCHNSVPKSRTDSFTQYECLAQKDACTEPDNSAYASNSASLMMQMAKGSPPANFSNLNIPPNLLPTNKKGFSYPLLQMPFRMSPDRQSLQYYDNAPESSSMAAASIARKKGGKEKKKPNKNSKPTGANSTSPPAQITATQWAVCRINTYSDLSKTYQIMQAQLKQPMPVIDENKTIMFFHVLPNGAAMSYVPASPPNQC